VVTELVEVKLVETWQRRAGGIYKFNIVFQNPVLAWSPRFILVLPN
jgi:hypothetical protein